jgi:hypothetical protein
MQYTRRIWSTSSLTRPEKRLARTLLLLARYGKEDQPQRVLPKRSREMLAKMISTTCSHINQIS